MGADWRWEEMASDDAQRVHLNIWSVVSGAGTLIVNGVYPFRAGDCFVLRTWDHILASRT